MATLAVQFQDELQDPCSSLQVNPPSYCNNQNPSQPQSAYTVDPNYFVLAIFNSAFTKFSNLSSNIIIAVIVSLLVFFCLCYCFNRKFFPESENLRIPSMVFSVIAFATNIRFAFLVAGYSELQTETYVSSLGLAIAFVLNLLTLTISLEKERKENEEFGTYATEHPVVYGFICFLSLFNTKHADLLYSKIFGLKIFSATIWGPTRLRLQFLACLTMFFAEVPCLACEIIFNQHVNSWETDATIAIVFNCISIFFGIFAFCLLAMIITVPREEGEKPNGDPNREEPQIEGEGEKPASGGNHEVEMHAQN